MDSPLQTTVSVLLRAIRDGHSESQERLIRLVYEELRLLADSLLRNERPDHTLEPGALIHEAWIRLQDQGALHDVTSRRHFFGAAARAMRQVLVDHARQRAAACRGGNRTRVPLDHVVDALERRSSNLPLLDGALEELAQMNQRHSQIVTLRFFGGLTMTEIAQQLQVSLSTVETDYRIARAWLRCRVLADK